MKSSLRKCMISRKWLIKCFTDYWQHFKMIYTLTDIWLNYSQLPELPLSVKQNLQGLTDQCWFIQCQIKPWGISQSQAGQSSWSMSFTKHQKSQGKLDTSTILELYTHIHKSFSYQRLSARKAKKEKCRNKNLALIKWKLKLVLKKSTSTQCCLTRDPPEREEL